MAEKTIDERISELQKRQEQLKAQEKALKAKRSQAERKARTKRLIEIGGAVESVLGRPLEKKDLPKFIAFLKQQETRGQYLSKAVGAAPASDTEDK